MSCEWEWELERKKGWTWGRFPSFGIGHRLPTLLLGLEYSRGGPSQAPTCIQGFRYPHLQHQYSYGRLVLHPIWSAWLLRETHTNHWHFGVGDIKRLWGCWERKQLVPSSRIPVHNHYVIIVPRYDLLLHLR